MNHDMHNMEIEMDKLLDINSDFIESLCKQLEGDGIHLTHDLLVSILSAYEEQKFTFLKEYLEQLIGQDNKAFGENSVVQVVLDTKRTKEDEEKHDPFLKVDSKYLV